MPFTSCWIMREKPTLGNEPGAYLVNSTFSGGMTLGRRRKQDVCDKIVFCCYEKNSGAQVC